MLAKKIGLSLLIGFILLLAAHPAPADMLYTSTDDFLKGELKDVDPANDQLQLSLTETSFVYINVAATGSGTIVRIDADAREDDDKLDIIGEYRTAPQGFSASPSRTSVDGKGNVWVANQGEDGTSDGLGGSVVKVGILIGGTRVDFDQEGNLQNDPAGRYLQGPFELNTCSDRNSDGLYRTSGGEGDVLAWSASAGEPFGSADKVEVPSDSDKFPEDECILVYQRLLNAENAKHVSVDQNDDVWVGGYPDIVPGIPDIGGNPKFFLKLDGSSGAILESFDARGIPDDASGSVTTGCGGFGGQIDPNGKLWSASRDQGKLLYYDPGEPESSRCIDVDFSYGLGIDVNGFIWNSMGVKRTIAKIDPDPSILSIVEGFPKSTLPPDAPDKGVAVSPVDNHVWVAKGEGTEVLRLDNDGNAIERIELEGRIDDDVVMGNDPTGVAVDANGKVWVTNLESENVMRIDPAPVVRDTQGEIVKDENGFDDLQDNLASTVDLTIDLTGSAPDNFSNMAAEVKLTSTPVEGTWTVVDSEGTDIDNEWDSIAWSIEADDPEGITVQARAANAEDDLEKMDWSDIDNGVSLSGSLIGKFLQVRVTIKAGSEGSSPVLLDLETFSAESEPEPVACFVNDDDIIDRNDINGIIANRNTPADPNGDPMDADGDEIITMLDARICLLRCTYFRCVSEVVED